MFSFYSISTKDLKLGMQKGISDKKCYYWICGKIKFVHLIHVKKGRKNCEFSAMLILICIRVQGLRENQYEKLIENGLRCSPHKWMAVI